MDNFELKLVSEGRQHLDGAISIAMQNLKWVTHYRLTKEFGMELFWYDPKESQKGVLPLPYKMEVDAVKEFIWNWFKTLDDKEFSEYAGKYPEFDGSAGKGFTLNSQRANGTLAYVQFGLKPTWAYYGK